jgi:hypothetical protein
MNLAQALAARESARVALSAVLRSLEGRERREALKVCRETGIRATELASLAGISRARLYQLLKR